MKTTESALENFNEWSDDNFSDEKICEFLGITKKYFRERIKNPYLKMKKTEMLN